MLTALTVPALLEAFAAPTPTPGGGSAAALSGAVGTALLGMVAAMPKTRTNTPEERTALDAAAADLGAARAALTALIDRDAAAYDQIVAAFRLPKVTDADKAARSAAIQAGTRVATEAPLETMRACVQAMRAGRAAHAYGNPAASSDVKVGFRLLRAAAGSAHDNVEINLDGLKDEGLRTSLRDAAAALARDAAALYATVVDTPGA